MKLLTITEAAAELGITRQRMHIFVKQGRIPCQQIGDRKFVTEIQLNKFANVERRTGRPFNNKKKK